MAEFKEIADYFDQLHRDIRQLIVFIEKLMGEDGYISLPSSGNRACWRITSHMDRPDGWRAPYLSRCYIPDSEADSFTESLLFLIVLDTDTIFDFPPIVCVRIVHPPLSEREIYNQVFQINPFKSLATSRPSWQNFRQEDGWIVAEPAFRTPITMIQAYILDLFSLSDQQKVMDYIVQPLREGGDLTGLVTLPPLPYMQVTE